MKVNQERLEDCLEGVRECILSSNTDDLDEEIEWMEMAVQAAERLLEYVTALKVRVDKKVAKKRR